jgi:hypothetical protein
VFRGLWFIVGAIQSSLPRLGIDFASFPALKRRAKFKSRSAARDAISKKL